MGVYWNHSYIVFGHLLQAYQMLGSMYWHVLANTTTPQQPPQCPVVKLINGTALDSVFHTHTGSLIVSAYIIWPYIIS